MRKIVILLSLGFLVFLAGCIQPPPTGLYKNDVITIENYQVSSLSPYSNSTTTIEFYIQNNADLPILNDVEVNFFDIPGFTINNTDCQTFGDDKNLWKEKKEPKCIFKKLESLDARKISLEIRAPIVISPTSYTISFSVKYDHYGTREALIPIIDGVTKKEPSSKFQQSPPSYSPILLDIQPSLEREVKVGDKVTKEYWGIAGRTFETKFKFTHVGTLKEKIRPINISEGNVRINLEGVGGIEPCDFKSEGGIGRMVSKKPVLILYDTPICNFGPEDKGVPEYTASIKVDYFYRYEFIKTETFVVQPRTGFK